MVCDVLTSLGFRDCEVAQKCWKGPTTDWLARGVPPSAAALFQPSIKDGAGQLVELVVVKESKRRKNASSSQGLRGETSVSFKSLIDVGKRAEKRHSEAPPDNAGPQDDVVMDSDDAKKLKTDPEAAKAKKKKPWYPEGAKRVANAGRGDCLFLAVADALAVLDPAKKASGRSVRAFLAAWFEKHYDECNGLWDGIKAGAASKETSSGWTGEFRDYIAEIKMSGIFGSYLELAAIAHSCQRDVLVLDEDGKVTSFSHGGKGKAICLFFQRSLQRYEFLSGDVQDELQFWASPHSGARNVGGGSLCLEDFASEASPSLRLSQFASVNGSGAAGSSAKPPAPSPGLDLADFASKATSARAPRLPSAAELRTLTTTRTRATKRTATASGPSAPHAHPEQDLVGCFDDAEPVPEPQRPKSRSKFAVDGGFRFECHLCPFASEHQSRHRATVAARLHYARVHPDRPNKRLHPPRAERPPLIAEEDASAPLRWTCPYCHKGWRSEDVEGCKNKLLIKWRAEHRDECHPRVSKANWRRALARARVGPSFRKRRRVAMLITLLSLPGSSNRMMLAFGCSPGPSSESLRPRRTRKLIDFRCCVLGDARPATWSPGPSGSRPHTNVIRTSQSLRAELGKGSPSSRLHRNGLKHTLTFILWIWLSCGTLFRLLALSWRRTLAFAHELRVATFNVPAVAGKLPALFDMLLHYRVQVVALQEVNITSFSRQRFRAACLRHGYNVVFGGEAGNGVTKVAILSALPISEFVLRSPCPDRLACGVIEYCHQEGDQSVFTKIVFASVYGHAAEDAARDHFLGEVVQGLSQLSARWMALGDFNLEAADPGLTPFIATGLAHCLDDAFVELPVATRRDGFRRIDFGLAHPSMFAVQRDQSVGVDYGISDHDLVAYDFGVVPLHSGCFRPKRAPILDEVDADGRDAPCSQRPVPDCDEAFESTFLQVLDRDVNEAWAFLSDFAENQLAGGVPRGSCLRSSLWKPQVTTRRSKASNASEPVYLVRLRRFHRRLLHLALHPQEDQLRVRVHRDINYFHAALLPASAQFGGGSPHLWPIQPLADFVGSSVEDEVNQLKEQRIKSWQARIALSPDKQRRWVKSHAGAHVREMRAARPSPTL